MVYIHIHVCEPGGILHRIKTDIIGQGKRLEVVSEQEFSSGEKKILCCHEKLFIFTNLIIMDKNLNAQYTTKRMGLIAQRFLRASKQKITMHSSSLPVYNSKLMTVCILTQKCNEYFIMCIPTLSLLAVNDKYIRLDC